MIALIPMSAANATRASDAWRSRNARLATCAKSARNTMIPPIPSDAKISA
jgi:hypothetical protein